MPVAQFGKLPPLKAGGIFGNFDPRFKTLSKHYTRLPKPVKKLFSFNTRVIVFDKLSSWWTDGSPHGCMDNDIPGDRALIILTPEGIENNNVYKLLLHEMSHTLDPCCYKGFSFASFSRDHFPDWMDRDKIYQRWKEILKKEPRPTEMSNRPDSLMRRSWMKQPQEQWACRMGITLIADYLVPAKLVKANDVALDAHLSVKDFKRRWPESYKFFHSYIRKIFSHA